MPYTFVSALVLPKIAGSQWKPYDVSNTIVSTLFSNYKGVILKLSIETVDGEGAPITDVFYADLEQLRTDYAMYENTLAVLLISIGNRTLDRLSEIPSEMKYIVYNDAVRGGYSYRLCKRGFIYPSDYPKDDFMDLELHRVEYPTDLRLLHTHCLVSVNGLFHMTDTDGDKAYIVDGGKSIRKKAVGHVGITSFYDIGKLSKVKILPDQIYAPDSQPLKEQVGFTINESTEGKSFFLILGGYLVLPQEGVFWKNGDNSFRLNMERLPYLERLLESQNFMSLEDLKLTESVLNETNLNVDEIWSDDVLKRYFSLSQSYLVIADTDNLFWNKIMLRQALMPGMFSAYQDPTYPLIMGHGRLAEYWKVFEDTQWAVTVVDSWYRNYIFNRSQPEDLKNITSQLAMDRPFFYSQGELLEIGSTKRTSVTA